MAYIVDHELTEENQRAARHLLPEIPAAQNIGVLAVADVDGASLSL